MALFGGVIAVLGICATIVVCVAFQKTHTSAAQLLRLLVDRPGTLEMLTVVVIGVSIFLLRILELIGPDAAVSALTGLGGVCPWGLARGAREQPNISRRALTRLTNAIGPLWAMLLRPAYLSQKLDRPLPTTDGGTLRTIHDARDYMTAMDRERERELRPKRLRAAKLILAKADVLTVSRALELALLYDAKLDVSKVQAK